MFACVFAPLAGVLLHLHVVLVLLLLLLVPTTRRPRRRADPIPRPANVIGEESTAVIVALNNPTVLQCYAVGWPRPIVTWWRADRMLPMTSETFEQRNDHSLYIRLVTINVLGPYTCQVYNGIGRASSWSVTLQAHGTSDNYPYSPYLVPPPRHPGTGDVIRLKPIVVRLTRPTPIYRTVTTPQHTEIETTQPPQQKVFTGKCHRPSPSRQCQHKGAVDVEISRGIRIIKFICIFQPSNQPCATFFTFRNVTSG